MESAVPCSCCPTSTQRVVLTIRSWVCVVFARRHILLQSEAGKKAMAHPPPPPLRGATHCHCFHLHRRQTGRGRRAGEEKKEGSAICLLLPPIPPARHVVREKKNPKATPIYSVPSQGTVPPPPAPLGQLQEEVHHRVSVSQSVGRTDGLGHPPPPDVAAPPWGEPRRLSLPQPGRGPKGPTRTADRQTAVSGCPVAAICFLSAGGERQHSEPLITREDRIASFPRPDPPFPHTRLTAPPPALSFRLSFLPLSSWAQVEQLENVEAGRATTARRPFPAPQVRSGSGEGRATQSQLWPNGAFRLALFPCSTQQQPGRGEAWW